MSITDNVQNTRTEYSDSAVTIKALNDVSTDDDDTVLYLQRFDNVAVSAAGDSDKNDAEEPKIEEKKTEIIGSTAFETSSSRVAYNAATGCTAKAFDVTANAGKLTVKDTSDYFGRKNSSEYSLPLLQEDGISYSRKSTVEYTYKSLGGNKTSMLVDSYKERSVIASTVIDKSAAAPETPEEEIFTTEYRYTYDGNGNITRIYTIDNSEIVNPETATLASYVYDEAGQLVRENNAVLGKTFKYSYDKGGNIISRKEYEFSEGTLGEPTASSTFAYDAVWKDKLSSFDNTEITYDEIGNPLNCVARDITGDIQSHTLEWNGRQLKKISYDGTSFEMLYNADGVLTERRRYDSENNVDLVTRYFWNGEKLAGYSMYDAEGTETFTVKVLYDNGGSPIGYIANNKEQNKQEIYTYTKNIQGDITGVCDAEGSLIVSYNYDAWGNVTPTVPSGSVSAALVAVVVLTLNPLAYRGYFYDVYTGLYYLQSRFYNPMYGRFLNADTTKVLPKTGQNVISVNMFAYCNNNPVMNVDFAGKQAGALRDEENYNNTNGIVSLAIFLILIAVASALLGMLLSAIVNGALKIADWAKYVWNNFLERIGVRSIPQELEGQLERAASKADERGRSNKTNRHHIVAKLDRRAEGSRKILSSCGIDLDSEINIAVMNQTVHWFIHTSLYHDSVKVYLDGFYVRDKNKTIENIIKVTFAMAILKYVLEEL